MPCKSKSIARLIQIWFVLLWVSYGCGISQPAKNTQTQEPQVLVTPPAETLKIIVWPLDAIRDSLHILFTQKNRTKPLAVYQEKLSAWYNHSQYQPLWQSAAQVEAGIRLLQNAANNGLNPSHYKVDSLNQLLQQIQADSLIELKYRLKLELELSLQVQLYAQHLYRGKLNPKEYHPGWNYPQKDWNTKKNQVLQCIQNQQTDSIENLLAPKISDYQALKQKLYDYNRQIANHTVPKPISYPGKPLHLGDSGKAVAALIQQLEIKEAGTKNTFDSTLLKAVKTFQKSHGLTPDGIAGPATYQFLNWPAERYLNALKVNMERLRWYPDSLPKTLIRINLPAFDLVMTDNQREVFRTRIIIGTPKHFSPVFQSQLDVLVFNPCWTIPQSIATKKLLPKIQKDASYLKTQNMFLAIDEVPIVTDSIDFSVFSPSNFPYKIYQNSGPGNALGIVKFLFNNPYQIYLHDTPQKQLFNADNRAFSHGCIRVKNPLVLAQQLLEIQEAPYPAKEYYLSKKYPVKVPLKSTIPIYIQYLTASTSQTSTLVNFFNDVYGLDLRVLVDLEKP